MLPLPCNNPTDTMMRILLTILLGFCNLVFCKADDQVLQRLNECLKVASKYDKVKQNEIKKLHQQASMVKRPSDRYKSYILLYEAYQSYKYDSASVYADKAMWEARQMNNPDYVVEATCAKVFCLLSAGLYKEAFDEIGKADISQVSTPYKYKYFSVKSRLYSDIADYCKAEPYASQYVREARVLTDTLKTFVGRNSTQYYYVEGMQLMKEHKVEESEKAFRHVLADKHISMHERAISLSCMGWLYKLKGDDDKAFRYLAESAICDIKSSTKETTAIRELGGILYAQGNVELAIEYMQKALDDANFYNARQRKIEIGNILPFIQQSRYKDMRSQRNVMLLCIVMAAALLIVLAVATILIKEQVGKLKEAKRTIEERNHKLEQANLLLSEANKIKTEYIGKSFYVSAGYFEKLEKLYRSMDHKLAAHQYDDLRRLLSERQLEKERKNMYVDFDETFLRLFPDFVDKYNQLFDRKDQKVLSDNTTLTNEMRIFALIRLGISDSERIAHFLNYSVNTINTYKTRVKNKSIVSNEEFEQRIMAI